MRAVLTGKPGEVVVSEVQKPVPESGEVLVRLRCCGVCGTDLEKVHGHGITTGILGHEEVGEVVGVGSGVDGFAAGDRVYAHHHVGCGSCELCKRGEQTLCSEYARHNLQPCGLAEYFIVPKYNVDRGAILRLPSSLGFEEASFIEPLACCIRGLSKAGAGDARSAVILGAGPVGLIHLKLLKMSQRTRVVVGDVSEYRLRFAGQMGADGTFNASDRAARDAAISSIPGGPDLVVLATGSGAAFEDALGIVGRGGTVLLFGAPKKDAKATIDIARFFLNGTRLVASYAATETETQEALDLIVRGKLVVSDMVTHRFPLERAADAFAIAGEQQCMKALITA